MTNEEVWNAMVRECEASIEAYGSFRSDRAIAWAHEQISQYKEAILILARAECNWAGYILTDEDEEFVATTIKQAEGG